MIDKYIEYHWNAFHHANIMLNHLRMLLNLKIQKKIELDHLEWNGVTHCYYTFITS
jgi:hypothetical protein